MALLIPLNNIVLILPQCLELNVMPILVIVYILNISLEISRFGVVSNVPQTEFISIPLSQALLFWATLRWFLVAAALCGPLPSGQTQTFQKVLCCQTKAPYLYREWHVIESGGLSTIEFDNKSDTSQHIARSSHQQIRLSVSLHIPTQVWRRFLVFCDVELRRCCKYLRDQSTISPSFFTGMMELELINWAVQNHKVKMQVAMPGNTRAVPTLPKCPVKPRFGPGPDLGLVNGHGCQDSANIAGWAKPNHGSGTIAYTAAAADTPAPHPHKQT